MLGRLPLFLCKPLRYQVSKQFTFYRYLFVFYTSCSAADWALFSCFRVATVISKQQCWTKKLGPATQTQSVLLNYHRNRWLLSEFLGTWRSNRLSSRPDLWSSSCFVLSWSEVFLLHTDPCLARQNHWHRESGQLEAAQMLLCKNDYTIKLIDSLLRVTTHLEPVEILTSHCSTVNYNFPPAILYTTITMETSLPWIPQ